MELLEFQKDFIELFNKNLNDLYINKQAYYIKGNKESGRKYLLNYIETIYNNKNDIKIIKFFTNEKEEIPYECIKKIDFLSKDGKFDFLTQLKLKFVTINISRSKIYKENLKQNKNYIINKIKQYVKKKTLIVLINNIDNLGIVTKNLIEEIFNNVDLKCKKIFIVFCSNKCDYTKDININYKTYELKLTYNDLKKNIDEKFLIKFDSKELLKLINNNIPLMKVWNQFIDIYDNKYDLNLYLERFIDTKFKNQKIDLKKDEYNDFIYFLQQISILKNNILEEHFHIIDNKNKLNDYLKISQNLNFIDRINDNPKEYYFYEFIKDYYYDKINFNKKELYEKLDDYFKLKTPENYLKRATYLINSSIDELIEKGLYLNLLNYTNEYKAQKLFMKINNFDYNLLSECSEINKYKFFYSDEKIYKESINSIFNNNFKKAILNLETISIDNHFNTAFQLEVLRNRVFCYYMLKDYNKLVKTSENLYDKVIEHKENEDDQLCKSIILLIGIFANNLNDRDKAEKLKITFSNIISRHRQNEYFEYFKVEFDRRTCIFHHPEISRIKLRECIDFFENNNQYIFENYYTLVNYTGMCLVCCEFTEFNKYTKKCNELEKKYYSINLQKEQKLKNNLILKEYLQKEKNLENKEDKILLVYARKALSLLKEIKYNTKNVSKVVDFNIVNFYLLCNEIENAEKLLNELESQISKDDIYYSYFFINSKIMLYYLKNDRKNSIKYLKQLEVLDTKNKYFFIDCENIIEKRKGLINELLNKQENLNQLELISFFLKDRMIGIEYYYCRPFLMSDLQYVSI